MKSFATSKGDALVIYLDDDVIIFSKPAGVLSERAEGSSEKSVLDYIMDSASGEVYPTHRLDRSTAGVMTAARNKKAASVLSELISSGGMSKEYLAAALGSTPASGRLEDDLFFDRRAKKSYVVKTSGRRGVKRAILEYKTIAYGKLSEDYVKGDSREISLLRVRLFTGRTHQIRAQLANLGHPLIGDGRYGGGCVKCALPLLSEKISFDPEKICGGYFARRPFGKYLESQNYSIKIEAPNEFPWNILDIRLKTT